MFSKILKSLRPLGESLKVSALTSLLLFLYQLLLGSSGDVLGKDLSMLRSAVTSLFPHIIAGELSKIFIISTITIWLIVSIIMISHRLTKLPLNQKAYLVWLPSILGIICLYISDFLTFPGTYSPQFSEGVNRLFYKLSFVLSPNFFFSLGFSFFIIGNYSLISRAIQHIATKMNASTALILLLMACGGDRSIQDVSKKPDIFLIAVDSLRSDHINEENMPFLYSLSNNEKSSTFLNHHIGVPRTFPSWIEILSGDYAIKNGIRHMFPQMDIRRKDLKLLPKKLATLGYHTEVISDFAGDIFPRFNSGFKQTYTPTLIFSETIRLSVEQLFPFYFWIFKSELLENYFKPFYTNPALTDPNRLVSKAVANLKSISNPIFQTIFFSTAHFPYASPYPYYNKYTSRTYKGPNYFHKNPELSANVKTSTEEISHIRNLYKGALSSIDEAIKNFYNELESSGRLENSIIIVTADHGEELFEKTNFHGHGEHLKNSHVTKVPLIIYYDKAKSKNLKTNSITRSIDIAPTIMDLVDDNTFGSGLSLKKQVIEKEELKDDRVAYSETGIWFGTKGSQEFQKKRIYYPGISQLLSFDPGSSDDIVLNLKFEHAVVSAKHRSLTKGNYKLLYTPTQTGPEYYLFNISTDPLCQNDVKDKHQSMFQELKKNLTQIIQSQELKHTIHKDIIL